MIRYGVDSWSDVVFASLRPRVEKRDGQWIDVELRATSAPETPLPDDLIDFSILAICTHTGVPIQFVPQDEGCDCEYQLTVNEKQQLEEYIAIPSMQELIRKAAEEPDDV